MRTANKNSPRQASPANRASPISTWTRASLGRHRTNVAKLKAGISSKEATATQSQSNPGVYQPEMTSAAPAPANPVAKPARTQDGCQIAIRIPQWSIAQLQSAMGGERKLACLPKPDISGRIGRRGGTVDAEPELALRGAGFDPSRRPRKPAVKRRTHLLSVKAFTDNLRAMWKFTSLGSGRPKTKAKTMTPAREPIDPLAPAHLRLQDWWARTNTGISTQPISDDQIAALEDRYGLRLPDDFREPERLLTGRSRHG